jgi:hypothetical protein
VRLYRSGKRSRTRSEPESRKRSRLQENFQLMKPSSQEVETHKTFKYIFDNKYISNIAHTTEPARDRITNEEKTISSVVRIHFNKVNNSFNDVDFSLLQ